MKILYDHQVFSWQICGGISRYFFELMKQFRSDGEPNYELSLRYTNNSYITGGHLGLYKTFFKRHNFRGRWRIISILNRPRSKKALSHQGFDVFHPTYYDPYFLKYLNGKPFVLTIYDMIHEIFPWDFPTRDKTSENKKLLAQKAAKIIAISGNTKNDIVRLFGIDEGKITVVYLGDSLSKLPVPESSELPVPDKYILFVGNRSKYKNFEFFMKAIASLLSEDEGLNIVCAGGVDFTDIEISFFKELGLRDRIHRFELRDEALAFLYRKALAFVFPSLYEGFGVPVLEAFGCGCPAVLSNTGALVETGGEAAVYFDPKSKVSIRDAVRSVVFDEDVRCKLRDKGYEQVKRFSWEKTAHRTAKVYKSVV